MQTPPSAEEEIFGEYKGLILTMHTYSWSVCNATTYALTPYRRQLAAKSRLDPHMKQRPASVGSPSCLKKQGTPLVQLPFFQCEHSVAHGEVVEE